MTLVELVEALKGRAELRLVDGRLQIDSGGDGLTPELAAEIAARRGDLMSLLRDDQAADGRDIIAALARRGISVRIDEDGRPLVRPVELIDEADMALLTAHRDAVLAALGAAVSEPQADCDQHGPEGVA